MQKGDDAMKKDPATINRREFMKTAGKGALAVGGFVGTLGALGTIGTLGFPNIIRAGQIKNPIKIGCQGVHSGPLGLNGEFMRQGAIMAVEEINSKGGILGSKIDFAFRDSEAKVDTAIKNARYFVNTWGADFLMGVDSSGVAMALGSIMGELNRILIVTHGSTNKYNEDLVYHKKIKQCFRSSIPLYLDGIGGGLLAAEMPYKRWGSIVCDYEYGHTSWKLFKDTLKKHRPDVEIVSEATAKLGTVDFSSQIAKVMAGKPEAIYSVNWGGDLVACIKQLSVFNVFNKIGAWLGTMGGAMDVLMGLGREYPEGLWGTTRYWFLYPDSPTNKAFVERYRKRWKVYPSHNSEGAYTAVYMVKQAVEKAKTLDIDAVIGAMEGMELQNRPAGPCYIRKEDHQAVYTVPWGQIKQDPKYPMPILTNLKVFPTDKIYRKPPFPPVA
jgi:branched-chain amino acid transport system substrate-binding protein